MFKTASSQGQTVKKLHKSIHKNIEKLIKRFRFSALMMQFIQRIPRNQLQIVSLEDKISRDNPVRFIDTFVNFTNMKRVNTTGIKNANKHVLMASLTYNLKTAKLQRS